MNSPLPKESARSYRKALIAAAGGERDLAATAQILSRWLTSRLGGPARVTALRPPDGAGIANETLLVDATVERSGRREGEQLVIRVKPSAVRIFPDPDFSGLFRLLDVLRSADLVRVPEVLWLEEDDSVLGSPFLVMRRLDGRVPVSEPPYAGVGWIADATAAERRAMWTSAVEELARIHLVPGEAVSLIGWPQYGATGEDQQLGYWDHYRKWSGVPVGEDMAELYDWILARRPNEAGTSLSWGDARIGNMIFGADFRLRGVLDWDQMSLASPRHDLAWWLLLDELNTTWKGLSRPEGYGSREDTIALWEARTGRRVGDLTWHEAFAAYKLALVASHTLRCAGAPEDAEASASFISGLGRAAAGLTIR